MMISWRNGGARRKTCRDLLPFVRVRIIFLEESIYSAFLKGQAEPVDALEVETHAER